MRRSIGKLGLLIALTTVAAIGGSTTAYACQNLYGAGQMANCYVTDFCGFLEDCITPVCENNDITCPDTQENWGNYCNGYNGCPIGPANCSGGRLKCPV